MFSSTLAQMIRKKSVAENRKVTIGEVAEATNLSRTGLSKWMNHPLKQLNADVITALADYFGVEWYEMVEVIRSEDDELNPQ